MNILFRDSADNQRFQLSVTQELKILNFFPIVPGLRHRPSRRLAKLLPLAHQDRIPPHNRAAIMNSISLASNG